MLRKSVAVGVLAGVLVLPGVAGIASGDQGIGNGTYNGHPLQSCVPIEVCDVLVPTATPTVVADSSVQSVGNGEYNGQPIAKVLPAFAPRPVVGKSPAPAELTYEQQLCADLLAAKPSMVGAC